MVMGIEMAMARWGSVGGSKGMRILVDAGRCFGKLDRMKEGSRANTCILCEALSVPLVSVVCNTEHVSLQ
jgi:hypothetical protein